jgi:hypothetical protein
MKTPDDQPRPDLDAAIDAVVPSLTTVGDDAAVASLRRTRVALAGDAGPRSGSGSTWRWAVPTLAFVTVLVTVGSWWLGTQTGPHSVVDGSATAPSMTPAPLPGRPLTRGVPHAPPRVTGVRPMGESRLQAASLVPPRAVPPRPDPLIALTRAVQAIPDDTWSAMARAQAPLTTPELATDPIQVPPLVTPPITDAPLAPLAEGDR